LPAGKIIFLLVRPAGANPLNYLFQTWADFGGWACLTLKAFFSKNGIIVSSINAKNNDKNYYSFSNYSPRIGVFLDQFE